MKQTPKLLLKLPEPTDFVLVEDLNENFVKIDEEITKHLDDYPNDLAAKSNKDHGGWLYATLLNGFNPEANIGVRYARYDNNIVVLEFRFTAGFVTTGTVIANLPNGYRPVSMIVDLFNRSTGTNGGSVLVGEDGNILIMNDVQMVTGQAYSGSVTYHTTY